MEQFLETFADESVSVQLQLLTATVKLFLKQPNGTQEMVQRVLQLATQGSDNPDLRDRGFVYWRLLSTDPRLPRPWCSLTSLPSLTTPANWRRTSSTRFSSTCPRWPQCTTACPRRLSAA